MTRRTRTFIVLTVALVTATVASASVYRAVRRIPVREVEVAHEFVVLAARPLGIGTQITAADVRLVGWPSSSPLAGGFKTIKDVVGRGLVTAVSANEPLIESKLAPREAGAGLSPAIPPGMRAISVKVNEVIGVAGFAVPGARVDVVATVRHPGDAVTRVLVANVQVLTAGTRYDQEKARDAKPIPSTVVTLMVTPEQAERIALASTEGQVTLMLRNPLDVDEPATPGARLARLVDDTASAVPRPLPALGTKPEPKPAKAITPPPQPRPSVQPPVYSVEAIRAGKRSIETVK
ncbi:MAG: Flp pilus assembly protein CpaB [Acidobacteria bacterium 13_1_40CM_65_14]|nr:MAG: Flp pilus assembly protein CpaB [Acidobacteria bacterium 13_1_40CM_65_14]OLC84505.1 MAG: Flp pilus assembly protein CpaB [Acidobacteria bacterium 13_1_40CM_4_65_8]OLD12924.1 MAG: Flp pilus assembly protein CpaB [Acidobacteria bacterium 13_1_40CM_3_65_5]